MLFDTHAHYDDARFDHDRDGLLASMPANGVGLILNPGCDLETSRKALSYAERFPHVYAAVGIHPENMEGVDLERDLPVLEALAQSSPRVRAIGEIGLDYYWVKEPEERRFQAEVFRAQMRLAGRLGLPGHHPRPRSSSGQPNNRRAVSGRARRVPLLLRLGGLCHAPVGAWLSAVLHGRVDLQKRKKGLRGRAARRRSTV